MYQIIINNRVGEVQCIKRISDNTCIPFDTANTDYQAYLEWIAESPDNVPLPADE